MNDAIPKPFARLFTHEAMNTTFSLHLCEPDEISARSMAQECFDRLDSLEKTLSRFIDGSDVSRINQLQAGETLYLNEACHQCLLAALDGYLQTAGLFDITLGRRIAHRKSGEITPPPTLAGKLIVHPDIPAVTCEESGREIDLGGIGKGFALDRLRELLIEWSAEGGLLTAGASSLLAFGPQPWPIDLAGNCETVRIILHNEALSASGTGIQGSHIIHPAGDEAMPIMPCTRLWVNAPTAAIAEVWSTALMLINPEEIPDFIAGNELVRSVHIDCGGKIRQAMVIAE